jgi:hypothetical protein
LEKALAPSHDVLDQACTARPARVTFDPEANAEYFYVHSGRDPNVVEQNIIGIRHGRTIEMPGDAWMNIDLNNFDRLIGIELLAISPAPADLLTDLSNLYP